MRKEVMFVNYVELDVLKQILLGGAHSQRLLAESVGHSLGAVNAAVRALTDTGLLDSDRQPTLRAKELASSCSPKNAVILAAGADMKMGAFSAQMPKALMPAGGEPLAERTVRQLHEAGINDIYIVVGFMKESFEYLIDKYGVKLIVNPDYAVKNNLWSLRLALKQLGGTYIIPGDIWSASEPFSRVELHSWYMVSSEHDPAGSVRVNRRSELVRTAPGQGGDRMIGIAYISPDDAPRLCAAVERLCSVPDSGGLFWEEALFEGARMFIPAKVVHPSAEVEINAVESLRDPSRDPAKVSEDVLCAVSSALGVRRDDISGIEVLKKGMTNRSFTFSCKGKLYLLRIPGEGTEKLINRRQEAAVYHAISGKGLCEDPVMLDPETGIKVTRYIGNARVCDPDSESDVRRCMEKLREFHGMKLSVAHEFDIFGQILFYEELRGGRASVYGDYEKTKRRVMSLAEYAAAHAEERILTHIDAVPDNFIFAPARDGSETVMLTDWEYAGMQDPHADIAMFIIYSLYEREQADRLIDAYFAEGCTKETRIKIYCYIAAGGLLWSNWCEYKRLLGVEFGEYSLRQYRFAKEYSRLAREMIDGA